MNLLAPTLFTFYTAITFWNVLSLIPVFLATVFWLHMIKKRIVNKYHNGSWWHYIKNLYNELK